MDADTLRMVCPQCGKELSPSPLFQHATNVVRRSCPRCRTHWQVVITPLQAKPDLIVSKLEWTALEPLEGLRLVAS